MTIALAEDMARSTTDLSDVAFGAMARAPVLFFGLELPDTIVYKRSTAFVDRVHFAPGSNGRSFPLEYS